MPFYFAFPNRRVKPKVKRSLTFGNKSKDKSRKSGFSTSTFKWLDNGGNDFTTFGNNAVLCDQPRRHSLQTPNQLDKTSAKSFPLRRLLTPLADPEASQDGPRKPPRMMEKKVFTCEKPECGKKEELLGMIAINFKACPACFTHYCSTQCRVSHWPEHKLVCHYGRITSYMKTISEICQGDEDVIRGVLSSVASCGYGAKGRGCVMLIFASPSAARLFIEEGAVKSPTYSSLEQVQRQGVKNNHQKNLVNLVSNYKPECELVLNVAIVAEKNLPASAPAPRNKEPCVIEQFIVPLKRNEEDNNSNEARRRYSL